MKNWKKLLFIALASIPTGLLVADDCCNSSSSCCDTNSNCNSCCDINTNPCCAGGRQTSKSVYIDVGFGESGTYLHENFFRNALMHAAEDGWGGAFQAVVFGGKTSDSGRDGLGRRFGFNHKRCLIAQLGADAATPTRDIDASNFNVSTAGTGDDAFSSTICFCPVQKVVGALLSWKQALSCNDANLPRWWFELNAPIVTVKHDMGFIESFVDGNEGGAVTVGTGLDDAPFVANMKDAFKQASWKYGKINGCRENTELANFEFKLGYSELTEGECCQVATYLGFAAPTTADRTAEYVFEPIVGQNHWAIIWGSTFDVRMCEWENSCITGHLALDARWWFERQERRSFDLINRPWSRYIALYANLEQAQAAADNESSTSGTSGINLLTRCVDVTPGYQINGNMGIMWEGCKFMFEVGHTFVARQAEKICPNWTEGPAVKAAAGLGVTNDVRTIGRQYAALDTALADYADNIIEVCDIDWNSGAHEGILAHSFYGSLGYNFDCWCYPSFISIGAAYDLGFEDEGTSVMRRWTAFGKFGFSF